MTKMVKVEEEVYCYYHGCVHPAHKDPYDYPEPDCKRAEWRTLYYRERKGD